MRLSTIILLLPLMFVMFFARVRQRIDSQLLTVLTIQRYKKRNLVKNTPVLKFTVRDELYTVTKNKKLAAIALALFLLLPVIAYALNASAVEIESVTVSVPILEQNPTNYAPVAENLNYTTYKGVAVCGKFAAIDPVSRSNNSHLRSVFTPSPNISRTTVRLCPSLSAFSTNSRNSVICFIYTSYTILSTV
jgi:hypothetical protein